MPGRMAAFLRLASGQFQAPARLDLAEAAFLHGFQHVWSGQIISGLRRQIVQPAWNVARAQAVVGPLGGVEGPLLPMLHAIQHEFGAISDDAIIFLAQLLNLTRAEVYGVVSFYHDFRRAPAGRRVVKVCRAEACQSVGGVAVAEALLAAHGLGWGDTSADGALTIEPVYCLGLCAVAPAALIDGEPFGRLDAAKLQAAVAA